MPRLGAKDAAVLLRASFGQKDIQLEELLLSVCACAPPLFSAYKDTNLIYIYAASFCVHVQIYYS
jgi:hypothetical protein